jgi:hypothetical protein
MIRFNNMLNTREYIKQYIRQLVLENIDDTFITLYHGTTIDKAKKIKETGLKNNIGHYDSANWYVLASDIESAIFHSYLNEDNVAAVLEFKIPVTNKKWEGYPYLWPPHKFSEYKKWYALKQPLPKEFIKKLHIIDYETWNDIKQNKKF